MLDISDRTTEKMKNYIDLMEKTVDGMKKIENATNVTEKSIISQISSAKVKAEELGDLQITSRTMAEQDLVQNSLEQAKQIVEESETQSGVTKNVEKAFSKVEKVSSDLLSINIDK